VEIVAQRGPDARYLVGGDLLALTAATHHDSALYAPVGDSPRDVQTDGRIVHRLRRVRPPIVDVVAKPLQRRLHVLFQKKARVIRADGDSHGRRLYYTVRSMLMTREVVISARGEERLRSGHPWIYRGDVIRVRADAGDVVVVRGTRGRAVGVAFYSSRSEIAIRMLMRGGIDGEPDISEIVRERLATAIAFRRSLDIDATAYRLVHAEADLLPSLIVDRYGEYLVVQTLSQGVERLSPMIVDALQELLRPRGILARNDPRARLLEGLDRRVELVAGEVPDTVAVRELGIDYAVDLRRGQKTGLFLDQRENRAAAALYAGGRLLDCFSYDGGFALTLARRCRETIAYDISDDAIARVRANAERNGLTVEARVGNVFDELRGLERRGERFDTIVLDPPAFAKTKAAVAKARAGYKEINLRSLKLLNRGGVLITCSCSYHVSEAMFAEVVYEAAMDAQTSVTVVEKRMQGRDHPVLLGVPETYYLKCLILRKLA